MTRDQLATASDLLASAAADSEAAESDRLEDIADQLDTLATNESGPDHGRLARIQAALGEVDEDVDADVSATIDDALDSIVAYRETLDGV